jgi:Protein of unknown function (DUF3108)
MMQVLCPESSIKKSLTTILIVTALLLMPASNAWTSGTSEILRYEMTWKGGKAGHGDVTTRSDSRSVDVVVQAVSDGYLKAIIEVWSRIQVKFSPKTFQPRSYLYRMRSNLLAHESVHLKFDHKKKLVKVDKVKGGERDVHSEKFSRIYDPVTAVFLLRNQKHLNKPMFVDIYDGKDRSRLFVQPAGLENINVRFGSFPAIRLGLRLVKLSDKKEIGTGNLWISNDARRIPLLLTSSPMVGTIRFELVQAQL